MKNGKNGINIFIPNMLAININVKFPNFPTMPNYFTHPHANMFSPSMELWKIFCIESYTSCHPTQQLASPKQAL
jgi:hypothetical protein